MICNGYLLGEDDDMSYGCKLTTSTNVDLHFLDNNIRATNVDLHFHVFSISIC